MQNREQRRKEANERRAAAANLHTRKVVSAPEKAAPKKYAPKKNPNK